MFEYIVTFAVLLTAVANFPQIYKVIKTKSAGDLSLLTFCMWTFITSVLFIHAIKIGDIYFTLQNLGMTIINIIIIALILKYGEK